MCKSEGVTKPDGEAKARLWLWKRSPLRVTSLALPRRVCALVLAEEAVRLSRGTRLVLPRREPVVPPLSLGCVQQEPILLLFSHISDAGAGSGFVAHWCRELR